MAQIRHYLLILISLVAFACSEQQTEFTEDPEIRQKIKMETNYGPIVFELYNETPLHRDNFAKLIDAGVYDSVLFHRVINEFMIQTGNPESRYWGALDTLRNEDLNYRVDAEFNKVLYHKRGAVAAARDGNPERASSGTQFYIVQRGPRQDSLIDKDEARINQWLARHFMNKDSTYSVITDSLESAREMRAWDVWTLLNDSLNTLAEGYEGYEEYKIPETHRDIYRSVGGTPHLDQNYTVFGEVLEGMNVVDSIARAETDSTDRPVKEARILSISVVQDNLIEE